MNESLPGLVDFFSPTFSYILELERRLREEGGSLVESPEDFQARLRATLDEGRARALAVSKRPQDVDEAMFALVAWVDEIMANYPDWNQIAVPLQITLFNSHNAGDDFYDIHLSRLTAQQDEVREIFYLVMCLGFVGRHYLDISDGGEWTKLKDVNARQLPHAPVAAHLLAEEHLTPQPYLDLQNPSPPPR
ncbi:MAG: DotU family type IV/VI secretion system protein, partial [Pseudomonadota bacterium]